MRVPDRTANRDPLNRNALIDLKARTAYRDLGGTEVIDQANLRETPPPERDVTRHQGFAADHQRLGRAASPAGFQSLVDQLQMRRRDFDQRVRLRLSVLRQRV